MTYKDKLCTLLILCFMTALASAEIQPETVGRTTMSTPTATWLLARDGLGSQYIFDAADGKMHGLLPISPFTPAVEANLERGEIYAAETYYSRATRGERTDVVTVYDLTTLEPVAEIKVPNKVAALPFRQYISLLDDRQHLTVFNMTPAQSVSIVNVINRTFSGEISTPGCALTMPSTGRSFMQICGDGRLQLIQLDSNGAESNRLRSVKFFDPDADPVFDKPIPTADGWLLVSFAGAVFDVNVVKDEISISQPWQLLTDADRSAGWRPGGGQFIAHHEDLNLLFILMNAKGEHSHDEAGSEVWIYSRSSKTKIGAIKLAQEGTNLLVSQGQQPLLTVAGVDQQLHVFDATSTKLVRTISEVGRAPGHLQSF